MSAANNKDTSQEMARDRTGWAEDRTVLVNERIFAGRIRTGLMSVGMGLTLQAIFKATEPTWAAKATSSVFVIVGIVIFYAAWRKSSQAVERLSAHSIERVSRQRFAVTAALMSAASAGVAVVLWLT